MNRVDTVNTFHLAGRSGAEINPRRTSLPGSTSREPSNLRQDFGMITVSIT